MFKVLVPAVAALGLVAFAAQSGSMMARSGLDDAPLLGGAMGWHLSHDGAIAKLAYGIENSDQLALMVTCMPGDASAVVYGDVQPLGGRLIQASMGPAPIDPLSGGDAMESRISLHDVGLRALADRGQMDVQGEAGTFSIKANREERRVVGEFLAYCAQGRA